MVVAMTKNVNAEYGIENLFTQHRSYINDITDEKILYHH
jgi:hypothetical protein